MKFYIPYPMDLKYFVCLWWHTDNIKQEIYWLLNFIRKQLIWGWKF